MGVYRTYGRALGDATVLVSPFSGAFTKISGNRVEPYSGILVTLGGFLDREHVEGWHSCVYFEIEQEEVRYLAKYLGQLNSCLYKLSL